MKNKLLICLVCITTFTVNVYSQSQQRIRLKLMSGSITWDNAYIVHNLSANDIYEQKDAVKLYNPDADLYTLSSDSVALSIDSRPLHSASAINLAFKTTVGSSYSIRCESNTIPDSLIAWLHDTQTGQSIALTIGQVYNFTNAEHGYHNKSRFKVKFTVNSLLPLHSLKLSGDEKPGGTQLYWYVEGEKEMKHYIVERSAKADVFSNIATIEARNLFDTDNYSFLDASSSDDFNFYRIKAVGKNGNITYSQVIKVNNSNSFIRIQANPVRGNVIHLELKRLNKEVYNVQLVNFAGQVVHNSSFVYEGQAIQKITANSFIQPGIYTLRLSGKTIQKSFPILFQ